MSFLLLQTFLLMAAAYFLGAFIGCLWRRVIYTAPEVVRESHASEAALAPAGGIELPAAAKPAIARQPEIEYVAPKGGVSDATRFERALSGSGMLGTHAVTPPVTPPPKPAPAVVVAKPVEVKPADVKVTEAKPVDVKPAAPVVPVVPAAAPVAKPVTTAAPIVAAPPKPAAAVPVTPAAPIAPAAVVAPPKADTELPTLVTTPLQKPAASAPSSEAVSVAAAVAAAAAASAAIKAAAKPAEPAASAPVSAKPAQPTAPVAAKPAAPPVQPTVNIKPAPAAHGVPVSSSGGMSGAVADVRVGTLPAPKPPAPKPAETAPSKPPVPAPAPAAAPAAAERQDLTLVRGIDARAQYLLNARGIYRYADIAKWRQGDVDQLNAALGAPRRIEREGWIEQASVLAAGGFTEYARQRLRGEIADTGAKPAAPAASVPAASAAPAKPAAEAPKPAVVAAAPAAVVAAAAAVAPAAKAAPAPAAEHQDLQLIRGLDEAAQRLLHERGITRYADIARWKSVDVDRFNSALGTPGRIEREGWIEQASVLASGTMTDYARRRLRGEFAVAPRPQAPLAAKPASASAPPPVAAVVKAPPAASPAAAAPKPQAVAGEAVAAAVAAAAAAANRGAAAAPRPAAASTPAPAPAASAPAPAPVPPAPRPTAAAPAGDILQRVRGIDAATERLLHTNGVTRYRQIAGWTAGDIEQFDALLASPGRIQRENWVEQASILAGSGDTAAADAASRPARLADAIRENTDRTPRAPRPDVGALRSVRSEALRPATGDGARSIGGARAPGAADDLKRIRGIGVLIEKKLNALGVSSYEQVANWTVADIERVSEQLDFRGRIERENWIEQARILSAGGQTEFSRRVDRGEVQ